MPNDIPLREAPDHFFDPVRWREFVAAFGGDREEALTALRPEPGLLAYYREEAANRGDPRAAQVGKQAALAQALVSDFVRSLQSGALAATALTPPSLARTPVPPELWPDIRLDFAAESATWGATSLTHIRIARAEDAHAPSLVTRCAAFLRGRQAAGEARKKILSHEARAELGDALTTRDFDTAYKEVFAKKRGRPRRSE